MNSEYSEMEAPRRARWVALAASGILVILVVGALGLALYLTVLRPAASAQEYRRPNPPVTPPATYYSAVEEQIAQGLGLSVAQVQAGIRSDPGEGLFGVATAQGVSPDQFYSIEINAHKAASAQMVASGVWTQRQADATVQYWQGRDAKALGSDMTGWFLHYQERETP
jgi:hypothetical protein